jgi:hypothetical protein
VDHQFGVVLVYVDKRTLLFVHGNGESELHHNRPTEALDLCLIIVYRSEFQVNASVFPKLTVLL